MVRVRVGSANHPGECENCQADHSECGHSMLCRRGGNTAFDGGTEQVGFHAGGEGIGGLRGRKIRLVVGQGHARRAVSTREFPATGGRFSL